MSGKKYLRAVSAAVILSILFLASCVSMNTEISIENNGRVTALMDYKVSQYVVGFGRTNNQDPFLPLPVTRRDFEDRVRQIGGTTLDNYNYKEDEDYAYITARLTFDSVDVMGRFLNVPVSLSQQNSGRVFKYEIIDGSGLSFSPENRELMESLFEGDTVKITLKTPAPIKEYSSGALQDGRKTVVFEKSVLDLLDYREKLVWTVTW